MKTKLSYSQLRLYQECGRKYYYHYKQNWRSKEQKSYFIFGSAVDKALNCLLKERDVKLALQKFNRCFMFYKVNNEKKYSYVPEMTNVVYAKADFDKDLLHMEDWENLEKFICTPGKLQMDWTLHATELYDEIMNLKAEKGFNNLREDQRRFYNYMNWLSMRRKGHIMIESYYKKVIPRIKEVIKIQGHTKLENSEGDIVNGVLDLILKWEDDKIYLMDNKTSARDYEDDSAARSQQLIGYYHSEKVNYGLNGIGYIVMYKHILKNKTKICKSCGKDGSGQRHKTCDAEYEIKNLIDLNAKGKISRCNGEWLETIDPECRIEVILDEVSKTAEQLVLDAYDKSNEGIKNEQFGPNLNACGNGEYRCQFFNKCWKGSNDDLVEVKKKEES